MNSDDDDPDSFYCSLDAYIDMDEMDDPYFLENYSDDPQKLIDTGQKDGMPNNVLQETLSPEEKIQANVSDPNANMSSQHCMKSTVFENQRSEKLSQNEIPFSKDKSLKTVRSSRVSIILSQKAQYFKDNFHLVFKDKGKLSKEYVNEIHKIIEKPLGLKPFSRDMRRSINKYFAEFENESEKIISYLVHHKKEIIGESPDLKNIIKVKGKK